MGSIRSHILSLLSISSLITASPFPAHKRDGTCTTVTQRKAWHNLTATEKKAYIDAELCLMAKPATMGIEGAQNRWDELESCHIQQTNVVHNVGAFLPWHRYYMYLHEYLLQTECGYNGTQPYWEEILDVDNLTASVIFDPDTGFGGDGTGTDGCVTDGPFANYTLHLGPEYEVTDQCLSRSLNSQSIKWAGQSYLDQVFAATNYSDAFDLFASWPHTAGHAAVGGSMLDVLCSPGDPIFFLHHTNLDRLWWEWQQVDPDNRLYDIAGRNIPTAQYVSSMGLKNVTAAQYDYFGDNGTETTLDHNLDLIGILPNKTARDVMDIQGGFLCYEYV